MLFDSGIRAEAGANVRTSTARWVVFVALDRPVACGKPWCIASEVRLPP